MFWFVLPHSNSEPKDHGVKAIQIIIYYYRECFGPTLIHKSVTGCRLANLGEAGDGFALSLFYPPSETSMLVCICPSCSSGRGVRGNTQDS